MYDAHINKMEYFDPLENIPFYLYVHHMCFKGMKFVCKQHEPMKQLILCEFETNL
jgi:hypothetical protein